MAAVASVALFMGLVILGAVTFQSSSFAAEREQWKSEAKLYGSVETTESPNLVSYLAAGAEYIWKGVSSIGQHI